MEINISHIDCGEGEDIIISLQNGFLRAKTMIHISPENIKVSPKYSIYNGELYEDNLREATEENSTPAPPATVHVLMKNRERFNTTVCLELNQHKYCMEWLSVESDIWLVVISSQHIYTFRRHDQLQISAIIFVADSLTVRTRQTYQPSKTWPSRRRTNEFIVNLNRVDNQNDEMEVLVATQTAPLREIAEQNIADGEIVSVDHEARTRTVQCD